MKEALISAGFPAGRRFLRPSITEDIIEIHDEPQHLYGYHGDRRPEKANIIIRRKFISGSSNDIGFVLQPDGTYKAIISEHELNHQGFNQGWLDRLNQHYAVAKNIQLLKKKGMKVTKKVEGSSIRIVGVGR